MSLVASISIPASVSLSLPKPHVTYQIDSLQSYQISRRYSQFVDFDAELFRVTGIKAPVDLPPKAFFRGPDLEQRRIGLENYMKAIVADKVLRTSAVLKQFLEVPIKTQHVAARNFYEIVRDVKADLHLARQFLQSHDADSYIQIKRALNNAEKSFAEIAVLEKSSDTSDAETRRRRDVCDELHRESLSLMTLAQNYRHSSQGVQNATDSSASPFAPKASGGRHLGPAQETAATIGRSNEELLQGQTQVMQQQDDLLGALLPVLQRQKELGNIIGQELDEQNTLLDELGASMDGLESKLKKGRKQITKITGKR